MGIVEALNGLDIRGECSRIQHSVLVLHGEHDQLLPVSESQALSTLMKNSKFQMIPGQGHCANTENPAAFVDLVESFAFCQ
jgi:pimeloyl-ACP methyl ester carboxylesterase